MLDKLLILTKASTDLFEARAILLGRLGRHDQALELYVYWLQDFKKAEECVRWHTCIPDIDGFH